MSEPLHRAPLPFFTMPNWVKAAARCGFNIEPVFREIGIETDLIHLDSMRISPAQLVQVMDACVARARGQHFPFVLGETFAFDYLPDIETFLATSGSLREAARVFDWVRELINPMIAVRIEERGGEAWLVLDLAGGEAQLQPKPYFCESIFPAIIKFGRALLGGQASFEHLAFRHPAPSYVAEYERFFRVPVRFDQAEHALVFARELLDRPLEGAFPKLHKQAEYLVEQRLAQLPRQPALIATLERKLGEQPQLLAQGIEAMARALGLSVRTLQRRLQEEGRSYAQLQGEARFRQAAGWLRDGRMDLESIAEQLGFSDRRSFTRAFTRWSGLSPSAFRGAVAPRVPLRRSRS